jgi:saccharopine dehydrogenase (NAD+, L-lysine-forming)
MAEASLHDLAADDRVKEVVAVDLNLARAEKILANIPNRKKISCLSADLRKPLDCAKAIGSADAVLNAAWYEFNLQAMDLALALKAHYADLGGLFHMTLKQLKRDEEFKKIGRCAALGCGSTPGITNMMVARLSEKFDEIDSVMIYDAGYDPTLESGPFVAPFSIKTMMAEYIEPAPVLHKGKIEDAPARSLAETLDFKAPIGKVKVSAVIHSEAATLPGYLKNKGVQEMCFKIAYPEIVERELARIAKEGMPALPAPAASVQASPVPVATMPNDFEILRIKITGRAGGKPCEKTLDCEITPAGPVSAGAAGVGFTGVIVCGMLTRGQTRIKSGTAAPESMLDSQVFFDELARRKCFQFKEKP